MIFYDSCVEIVPQEPTLEGAYKVVERAARVSHLSEGKITEDSYKKLCNRLQKMGHMSPFEFGTVYLRAPIPNDGSELVEWFGNNPYSSVTLDYIPDVHYHAYITTNLRVLIENDLLGKAIPLIVEPRELHTLRVTTHWVCSRAVQQEVTRHRSLSHLWESTRYVKYDEELPIVKPTWCASLTRQIETEEHTEKRLIDRYNAYIYGLREAEKYYKKLRETDLLPEYARGILPLDLKSEGYVCGTIPQWEDFFELRCSKQAHPDIRVLAGSLKEQFKKEKLI